MRKFSHANEFCMQYHFHANQSQFHMKGFALRLALNKRHKGTTKWPITPMTFKHQWTAILILVWKTIEFICSLFRGFVESPSIKISVL